METIRLRSRGVENSLVQIKGNKYKLVTKGMFVRCEYANEECDAYKWLDPEGGPMITVGDTINGKKIKSIYRDTHSYIIEFEE